MQSCSQAAACNEMSYLMHMIKLLCNVVVEGQTMPSQAMCWC